jgi:hypothetical protein
VGSEIGVAAAAAVGAVEVESELGGHPWRARRARATPAFFSKGGRLRPPVILIRTSRLYGSSAQAADHVIGIGDGRHAQVDGRLAMRWDDIFGGAAFDAADVEGNGARVVGHGLDIDDLPRHLEDRGASLRMTVR